MELGKIIAINLNELRTERNLTLGQLSKISGISKAMLSDIEKGNSNPTINTLWKIANGLNVPYTRLMEGIEKEATVIRKSEQPFKPAKRTIIVYIATLQTHLSEILNCSMLNWMPTRPTRLSDIRKRHRSISTLSKVRSFFRLIWGIIY